MGRPRPNYTIDRDAAIRNTLAERGPMTRNALARVHSLTGDLTYGALRRLRRQNKVQRVIAANGDDQWAYVPDPPPVDE